MWMGALGVRAAALLYPAESDVHLAVIRNMAWLSPESGAAYPHLAFFLLWGRAAVALCTTLGLAALYPLLARLFDRRTALLAIGLLSFDPFLAGHSGLLHTDALLATSALLALAAALNGLRDQRSVVWWILSGLSTGLAILTKSPGVILLPFVGLIAIVQLVTRIRQAPSTSLQSLVFPSSSVICHLALYISAMVVTCFALYPALWSDPAGVHDATFAFAGQHVKAALRPVFFLGRWVSDPSLAYYPVVLLVRASPIALIGLVIGLVGWRRLPTDRRFAFVLLLAFGVAFGTLMSLGAKKHDRYLLPALCPLAVIAALGWHGLATPPKPRRSYALLAVQLLLTLLFLFYPLAYANPLVGGPTGEREQARQPAGSTRSRTPTSSPSPATPFPSWLPCSAAAPCRSTRPHWPTMSSCHHTRRQRLHTRPPT
jgi:4-amino-4-deoxy-L-arabinose transferase-like glycosyltransferase